MFDKEQLTNFRAILKGIFALKVGRSTFREVQNAAMQAFGGNEQLARDVFECLMTGKIKTNIVNEDTKRPLQSVIDDFGVPLRLAREVAERGEFISVISSDALPQNETTFFLNRLRRIDGEEFHFLTDVQSTTHLLGHLIERMGEVAKTKEGRDAISKEEKTLRHLAERLQFLTGAELAGV